MLWWLGMGILALLVFALIGAGVPFSYSCCGGTKDDVFRVVPGSLAAAVTAAGVVIGLGQYIRNSHERRVERSMVFWQRSNTVEFTKHLTPYLKHLWKRTMIRAWPSSNELLDAQTKTRSGGGCTRQSSTSWIFMTKPARAL